MRSGWLTLILLSMPLATVTAQAQAPDDDWQPVSDARLEAARGGVDLGNGLILSLGVERLVSINGNVLASSNFSIADVSRPGTAQARAAGEALAAVTLVQNGGGNLAQVLPTPQGVSALIIQNSANDQLIRSQTTISTAVTSLSLLKQLNFEGSLRDALSGALGHK